MIYTTYTTSTKSYTQKSIDGYQFMCVYFLTSVRNIMDLFLDKSKSQTAKLPIIYANIRV